MEKTNLFGINLSLLDKTQVLERAQQILAGGVFKYFATVNPEFMLAAQKDEEFFYILNKAELAVVDGFGLRLATFGLGTPAPRITGADLMKDLLQLAAAADMRVLVLLWRGGLSRASEVEAKLAELYPGLKFLVKEIDRRGTLLDAQAMQTFGPALALVALGAPWQEKLIYHKLKQLSSLRLAMGVGGSFDFMTDRVRRAPKLMRVFGIEWLWRLIKQPRRFKRIYNAVFVFSWKFFMWRCILPFFYRDNVACMLYKIEAGKPQILIVERSGQTGHWQLPQGGTDGEKVEVAGARELGEELGTKNFAAKGSWDNLWQYEFDRSNVIKHPHRNKGYRGQRQGLFVAEFLGKDEEIQLNFWDHQAWRWVGPEELVAAVFHSRRGSTEVYLEKFNSLFK